ncbi:GGDEF domain-containing protein [Psychrosphaera sp. B3R10]|nr:GGDEF domain-containing protein [Psychrosphaera sp. 1_MG-2023]MBU2883906.1 GGDEF domain-containing protein [Psychrosphaera sp. I2R16]MBU2988769.1 GGDEF domain-containing protein [Psychrosphaera sp. B3R10]MDO6718543.1 GGDEF domain-containing protein [Psychrosphaera sp. 1_MG-2023]
MDYISHLDVLNPEANASIMASWTNFSKERDNNTSLIEQLQTTLDIEQLLAIYLNALAGVYKVNAIRLETFQNTFTAGTPKVDSQKLTLPIRIDNKLMGKISYFTDKKVTDILMSSLTGFQKSLVFPLRNALAFWQLQQMALKDALTGVGNRAMYNDAIARAIQYGTRYKEDFVLMILDLDNFKNVNDSYGHQTGDDILTGFTQVVSECLRAEDQMFRFGGDEFAIILDKQGLDAAKIVASRIHFAVSQQSQFIKYGVSTSIGCACFNVNDTTLTLFARADKALYAAKYAGKNCMKTA